MSVYQLIQIFAILLTGLLAGLLYGYDSSVINGLGNLSDKEYLKAFQSVNRAILNPYFFVSFIGSLLLLPTAAWLSYKGVANTSFYLLLAATVVSVVFVFGVTAFGNVPLNNLLDRFDIATSSEKAIAAMRQKFETSWNRLHHIRTYAAILSFFLAIISAVKKL